MDSLRSQTRWFGGMVGNHIADIVSQVRRGHGGQRGLPAGARRLHQGPHRLRLQHPRQGRQRPRRTSCRTRSSTGSASSAPPSSTSPSSRELKARSASTSSRSTSSTTTRRRRCAFTASRSCPTLPRPDHGEGLTLAQLLEPSFRAVVSFGCPRGCRRGRDLGTSTSVNPAEGWVLVGPTCTSDPFCAAHDRPGDAALVGHACSVSADPVTGLAGSTTFETAFSSTRACSRSGWPLAAG